MNTNVDQLLSSALTIMKVPAVITIAIMLLVGLIYFMVVKSLFRHHLRPQYPPSLSIMSSSSILLLAPPSPPHHWRHLRHYCHRHRYRHFVYIILILVIVIAIVILITTSARLM